MFSRLFKKKEKKKDGKKVKLGQEEKFEAEQRKLMQEYHEKMIRLQNFMTMPTLTTMAQACRESRRNQELRNKTEKMANNESLRHNFHSLTLMNFNYS